MQQLGRHAGPHLVRRRDDDALTNYGFLIFHSPDLFLPLHCTATQLHPIPTHPPLLSPPHILFPHLFRTRRCGRPVAVIMGKVNWPRCVFRSSAAADGGVGERPPAYPATTATAAAVVSTYRKVEIVLTASALCLSETEREKLSALKTLVRTPTPFTPFNYPRGHTLTPPAIRKISSFAFA